MYSGYIFRHSFFIKLSSNDGDECKCWKSWSQYVGTTENQTLTSNYIDTASSLTPCTTFTRAPLHQLYKPPPLMTLSKQLFVFVSALLASEVVATLPIEATQLTGQHLHITTVEASGAMDIRSADGTYYSSPEDWSGFLVDQIEWISSKAGFTYSLHLPSGMSPACKDRVTSATKPYLSSTWSTQYKCGEQDVDFNRTDMYWGLYYYTPGRAKKNLMTIPFITNVGLSLAVSSSPPTSHFQDIMVALETPFRPFTPGMWAAIIFTFVIGAVFMWLIEVSVLSFVTIFTAT